MSELNNLLELYATPENIQSYILKNMEDKIGDNAVVSTPNNVGTFLIEAFSTMASDIVKDMFSGINKTAFPKRALTLEDLFKHMSDYDYVGLFAVPSTTNIELTISIDNIKNTYNRENINSTDTEYVVKIPNNTEFYIGKYTYTLHYPIIIKINKTTDNVIVYYDNSFNNPLYALASNILENRVYKSGIISILSINVPVHQFTRSINTDEIFTETPFSKRYSYKSNFYAARLYTNKLYSNNENVFVDENGESWTEMHTVLNDDVYDPDMIGSPTAIIAVDQQNKNIKVTIPYVFISQNRMGTRLRVELFDTEGVVDIDASSLQDTLLPYRVPLSGNDVEDRYVKVLTDSNNINVSIINTRIIGGSFGINFENLRQRVIYNSFSDQLLVLPTDIEGYFKDVNVNFKVNKFKDGITSRIFMAHKELRDVKKYIVSSGDVSTLIDTLDISEDVDNTIYPFVKRFTNGSYMLLPGNMFKYDLTTNSCSILKNTDVIKDITSENIALLNNSIYTFNPFYTRLYMINNTPLSSTYELDNPKIKSVNFEATNNSAMIQASVNHVNVSFNKNTNNYVFSVEVKVSTTLLNTDGAEIDLFLGEGGNVVYDNIRLMMHFVDKNGKMVYVANSTDINGIKLAGSEDSHLLLFTINLGTDYNISDNDLLTLKTDIENNIGNGNGRVNLNHSLFITCFVADKLYNQTSQDITNIEHVNNSFKDKHYAVFTSGNVEELYHPVYRSRISVEFGKHVSELFNGVDIVFDDKEIALWDETAYARHEQDTFKKNINGNYEYSLSNIFATLNASNIDDFIGYTIVSSGVIITEENKASCYGTDVNIRKVSIIDEYYKGNYKYNTLLTVADLSTITSQTKLSYINSNYWIINLNETESWTDTTVLTSLVNNAVIYISGNITPYQIVTNDIISSLNLSATPKSINIVARKITADINLASYNNGNTIGIMQILHSIGDPKIFNTADNVAGENEPDYENRNISYRVNMLHINSRLLFGDLFRYAGYVTRDEYIQNIKNTIIDHCSLVNTVKNRLLPNTDIYYRPSKTIGTGKFKTESTAIIDHPLEFGIELKIYVSRIVIGNSLLLQSIKNSIINIIINNTTKTIFSITDIVEEIYRAHGDVIFSVDITGLIVNGVTTSTQTLIYIDNGDSLNLKQELKYDANSNSLPTIEHAVNIVPIAID